MSMPQTVPPARRTCVEEYAGYLLNDSGNADRLITSCGERLLWVEDRGVLMAFDGKRWKPDILLVEKWMEQMMRAAYADAAEIDNDETRKRFLHFVNASLQRYGISNAIHSAKRKCQRIRMTDFDADPYVLNFSNGTVCLRTGERRHHNKDDHITKLIPHDYDASAVAPSWLEFLFRTQGCGPDSSPGQRRKAKLAVEYIQKAVGCSATGISTKHLFVCYGPKDTGKTTFQETIREALGAGQYSGLIQIDTLMMRSDGDLTAKADIADLQGLRFVSTGEVEKGRRLAVARVKSLTGGGDIRACRKHENPFTFRPTHTIWMDTNERPFISDPHDAVWGRMRVVPFLYEIPKHEQQADFINRLLKEEPGIAAWIVEGAMDYLRAGLTEPPEVLSATEEYRQESDQAGTFLREQCEVTRRHEHWVSTDELWTVYTTWAESAGESPLRKADFENQIEKFGCKRQRNPKGNKRAWRGIRLAVPKRQASDT